MSKRDKFDTVHTGVVREVLDFGVQVKLPSGCEGLLHIIRIPQCKEGKSIHDIYKVGDKVKVKVINSKPFKIRLGLV